MARFSVLLALASLVEAAKLQLPRVAGIRSEGSNARQLLAPNTCAELSGECGTCAGTKALDGQHCYFCLSTRRCMSEAEYINDVSCPLFSTSRSECGGAWETLTAGESMESSMELDLDVSSMFRGPCPDMSSCGECTGASYTDLDGTRASCYWCEGEQACISTAEWEASATCTGYKFNVQQCPPDPDDMCTELTSCDACVTEGWPDETGKYQPCLWSGDQCGSMDKTAQEFAFPQRKCRPEGSSRATCAQLQWPVAPGNSVCAASKIEGKCSNLLTFDAATAWCEAAGARLCRSEELAANLALRSGCKLDEGRVWTASSCINGHISQAGAAPWLIRTRPSCDEDDRKRQARCCADEPKLGQIRPPTERKFCEELEWEVTPHSPLVCSSSYVHGLCVTSATFEQAQAACFSQGARLCSQQELETNEAKGSGCKLDQALVWSNTLCDGGVVATRGSAMPQAAARCMPLSKELSVRCCADVKDAKAATQTRSCEDLRWPVVRDGRCAESKLGGRCSGARSMSEAQLFCAAVGAAVCSASELTLGVAGKSGCKLDEARVWTSSPCPGGFLSMAGHPAFLKAIPQECVTSWSGVQLPVRCCAQSGRPSVSVGFRG